jgi:acetyl esterase/lipase
MDVCQPRLLIGTCFAVLAACGESTDTGLLRLNPVAPQLSVTEQPVDLGSTYFDLSYANRSPLHKLDLHLPASGKRPYPVVVWVHGGAWWGGDKALSSGDPVLRLLTSGIAVASINYRLSQHALFPAQIHDLKAAVRWLRANAPRYGLDTSRVGTWGQSSGAHLAALLGTSSGVASLTDPSLGNPTMSDRVDAVVDWAGPIRFLTMDAELKANGCPPYAGIGHNSPRSPPSRLLGAAIQTVPSKATAADPETYVDSRDPPFLIQHGTSDCLVPMQQSRTMSQRLAKVIGPSKVTLHLFPGIGHGGPPFYAISNTSFIASWFKSQL